MNLPQQFNKKYLKYCSPQVWVASLTNVVLRWVGQKTILGFLVWEIAVCAFTLWWVKVFSKSFHHGWYFHEWKAYFVFTLMRMATSGFGIYAVYTRDITKTKIYYGLFWFCLFLILMTVVPIGRMTCDCTNFLQCKSLQSFSTLEPGKDLLNPFQPVNLAMFNKKRMLEYDEPPATKEIAWSATKVVMNNANSKQKSGSSGLQRHAQVLHARSSSLTDQDRLVDIPSNQVKVSALEVHEGTHEHGDLHQKLHRDRVQEAGCESVCRDMSVCQSGLIDGGTELVNGQCNSHCSRFYMTDSGEKVRLCGTGALYQGDDSIDCRTCKSATVGQEKQRTDVSLVETETFSHEKHLAHVKDTPQIIEPMPAGENPLKFFNVSDKRIRWVSDEPICKEQASSEGMPEIEGISLRKRLAQARQSPGNTTIDRQLNTMLWLCIVDPFCSAVSAELIQTDADKKTWKYKVCELDVQTVPVVTESNEGLAHYVGKHEKKTWGAFFQKNPVEVANDLQKHQSQGAGAYYQHLFREVNSEQGMTLVRGLHDDQCTCEREHSCRTHTDVNGMQRFWCWVDKASRKKCEEKNIVMYYDKKNNKLWSEQICESNCECSNVGMYPPDRDDKVDQKNFDANGNKLNYGAMCGKWKTDDRLEWCYVGFDSTCADRTRPAVNWENTLGNSEMTDIPMQYASQLPCGEDFQDEQRIIATDRCENWSWLAEIICILDMLVYCPLGVIIFKFLSNRCGDEFKNSDQFAVVLSSDDESSDDDWEKGAAPKAERTETTVSKSADPGGASSDDDDEEERPKPPEQVRAKKSGGSGR